MTTIGIHHFQRAAADIGSHGDNDMLPFDVDTKLVKEKAKDIASIAYDFCSELIQDSEDNNKKKIKELNIYNEQLLAPTRHSGFRISTKIHPFWTVYFNGLGIYIAEQLEPKRYHNTYSYRFASQEYSELFDRQFSWKYFRKNIC